MKRIFLALFAIVTASCAFAQQTKTMVVRQTDGTEAEYQLSSVEKVYFKDSEPEPQPEPEYVDLGLPSGVKWAACNLGANAPEEYGDYYGWGCTKPYQDSDIVDWPLYFQMIGGSGTSWEDCGTDKDPLKDYVYPNHKSIAGTQWDAAHAQLGGKWRMPTLDEQKELLNSCTWTWTTQNGVNGYLVTGPNGNSIFLPAAGYRLGSSLYIAGSYGNYWGSTPDDSHDDGATGAYGVYFYSGSRDWGYGPRDFGFSVRPVYVETPEPQPEPEYVDLGLSVKWATCNLGASAPEEYGDYYGWGCTKPYQDSDNVDWATYFTYIGGSGSSSSDLGTDKDPLKDYVYPNQKSIAGTQWDAARAQLGGKWRMPTLDEQKELNNSCTWTWTTQNGVNGYRVTGPNGNSIFLPAAGGRYGSSLYYAGSDGSYWSSTPRADYANDAYGMYFYSGGRDWSSSRRNYGHSVRPVSE